MILADEIALLSLTELSARVGRKEISPVDLTETYLARIEKLQPKLNCFVTVTRESALEEAGKAAREISSGHRRGPLHGIPCGVKDLLDTAFVRTTWGAAFNAERRPTEDATVVKRLREAGAILLGKPSMIELAGGLGYKSGDAAFNGPCATPWDGERWAGGSSSGSGSATAAGLVGFSIGSETWGSIVCPSSFCGATGLRPTYGVVSRHGAMALSFTLDKLGPICRAASDTRLVLAAIAGKDPLDDSTVDPPDLSKVDPKRAKGIKAALLPMPEKDFQPGVVSAFRAALETLRSAGVSIEEATLPAFPWEETAGLFVVAEAKAAFADILASGKVSELAARKRSDWKDDPTYSNATASDYVRAMQMRRVAQGLFSELFRRYDVILWPGMPAVAPPKRENLDALFNGADPLGGGGNLCGLPAVCVPCGFSEGLPVALQVVGPAFGEGLILSVAEAFQERSDFHKRRPPLS